MANITFYEMVKQSRGKTGAPPVRSLIVKFILSVALILSFHPSSFATPVFWTANITFNDGGTIGGSFVFDEDTGVFSAINLFTQGGTARGPADYHGVILQNTSFFVRLVPDNTLPDLTLQPVLTVGWAPKGSSTQFGTSLGLSNAGGLLQAMGAREETCANVNCTSVFGGPSRLQFGFQGVLVGTQLVPEPPSSLLIAVGFVVTLLCGKEGGKKAVAVP